MQQTTWKFQIPDSECVIEVRHGVGVFEIWIEIDHDSRDENVFKFGGEYLTFEEAVSGCFQHIKNWNQ